VYSEAGRRANDGERQTDGGRGAATYTSTMAEWFADESLWEAIYPFEFPDAVIAAGETQVASALRLRGVPRPSFSTLSTSAVGTNLRPPTVIVFKTPIRANLFVDS